MSITINTNVSALTAQRDLSKATKSIGKSFENLSSGLRVDSSKDDAAGLSISTRFESEIRGQNQATRNMNDGISVTQIAEGGIQHAITIMQRMRELAVQASNDTYTLQDRKDMQKELDQLATQMNTIARDTHFNGQKLLDGTFTDRKFAIDHAEWVSLDIKQSIAYSDIFQPASEDDGGDGKDLRFVFPNKGEWDRRRQSGIDLLAEIPRGLTDIKIQVYDRGADDDIQIFTKSGQHIAGTNLTDSVWIGKGINTGNIDAEFITPGNGFNSDATYKNSISIRVDKHPNGRYGRTTSERTENLSMSRAAEDLLVFVVGSGWYDALVDYGEIVTTPEPGQGGQIGELSVLTQGLAELSIAYIDTAINMVSSQRSEIGAFQNRLESVQNNLSTSVVNTTQARSRILDADMAKETANLTKNNIIQQASTAILAQANQQPSVVMQLLR